MPRTLFDKIWDAHVVERLADGTCVLYIDRHLVHEVTSPQAFVGLRAAGRGVRRPDATIAVVDHNVPTSDRAHGIAEPESRLQVATLEANVAEFGVPYFPLLDERQGIVHVIGPEQGISLPGMTIVCGDSHTSTHGAMGALAFGIGTSEVEHVLATQSLSDAARSGILDVLIESCPTKIFLPNEEAGTAGTPEHPGPRDLYEAMGLNATQIEIIRTATKKRHYYLVSPEGRRLFDLGLGPVALSFAGISSKEQIGHLDRLAQRAGARWPFAWLAEQGIDHEALA